MADVSCTAILKCSSEQLRKAILDFDNYHKYIKECQASKKVPQEDGALVGSFVVKVLTQFHYSLKFDDQGLTISWKMIDGDIFEKMEGHWELVPQDDGSVEAAYSAVFDFKIKIPERVKRMLVGNDLKEMMTQFESWALTL